MQEITMTEKQRHRSGSRLLFSRSVSITVIERSPGPALIEMVDIACTETS
jgi:hypothetical protein